MPRCSRPGRRPRTSSSSSGAPSRHSDVAATICLRYSDGFSKPLPSAIVVVGYAFSFYLLALVLRDISVSTAYAIWSGAGTAAVAIIGIAALGEPGTALKLASIALIVAGVIGLNLSGAH